MLCLSTSDILDCWHRLSKNTSATDKVVLVYILLGDFKERYFDVVPSEATEDQQLQDGMEHGP
jgi:hypothetical protein